MKRKLSLTIVAAIALAVWGCAVLGGGQTDPILSKLIPNTLYDNADVLAGNATNSCNAGAAKEYNLNMVICSNPQSFVAQLPGNPFVTPAQIASAIAAVCATNSYSGKAPTVSVGNCVFPTPAPSPSAAH